MSNLPDKSLDNFKFSNIVGEEIMIEDIDSNTTICLLYDEIEDFIDILREYKKILKEKNIKQ